jgi:TFIIF-interacting CTD phosphatase-like protein
MENQYEYEQMPNKKIPMKTYTKAQQPTSNKLTKLVRLVHLLHKLKNLVTCM